MKKHVTILLLLITFSLAGCGHQQTARNYIKHPQRLKTIIEQCNASQNVQPSKCVFAINLFNQLINLSHELIMDQEAFGRKILNMQMQQAKLKEKIASTKNQEQLNVLTKKYQRLTHDIGIRLALVADAAGML